MDEMGNAPKKIELKTSNPAEAVQWAIDGAYAQYRVSCAMWSALVMLLRAGKVLDDESLDFLISSVDTHMKDVQVPEPYAQAALSYVRSEVALIKLVTERAENELPPL